MASFSSATFLELSNSGYPTWNARELLLIKDKPAGNTPAIKSIGADVQKASISALCTAAELVALYDLVLESGSLVMNWETHSALLESMGEAVRVGFEDLYQVPLNFIRL